MAKSFSYAIQGLLTAIYKERNLRFHLFTAAYTSYFALRYYNLTRGEIAVLVLTFGLVISAELMNTAIETGVDLTTTEWSPIAKAAKDIAAGGVLVTAIVSVIIGIILFWDTSTLKLIFNDIIKQIYIWLPLIAVTILLIYLPQKHKENDFNGN